MYKVDLRTIKSATAVFICFCLDTMLIKKGYPFYFAVIALILMQKDVDININSAKKTIIGIFAGGIAGLIVNIVCMKTGIAEYEILYYFVLSLFIVVITYSAAIIKIKTAVYISCVVFLCITVLNREQDIQSVCIFALLRVFETLLGIFVCIFLNMYNPYVKPDRNILFITDLDGTLLNRNKVIPNECVRIINRQIKNGMNFTVATARTPATLKYILKDIKLNIPVVCMGGAAIYDIKTGKISNCVYMEKYAYKNIIDTAKKYGVSPLTYTVSDNHVFVYYNEINNEPLSRFCREREKLELKKFIRSELPENTQPMHVMFLDKSKKIRKIYEEFKECHYSHIISLSCYEDIYEDGYSYLEIYSIRATKAEGLKRLKEFTGVRYTVSFGDNENDITMLRAADYSYAVGNATDAVKNIADSIIDDNESGGVGKVLKSFSGQMFS